MKWGEVDGGRVRSGIVQGDEDGAGYSVSGWWDVGGGDVVGVGFDVGGEAVVLGDAAIKIKATGHLGGDFFEKGVCCVDGGKSGKGVCEDFGWVRHASITGPVLGGRVLKIGDNVTNRSCHGCSFFLLFKCGRGSERIYRATKRAGVC